MSPSNGSLTHSPNGASLRPRTRRLISDLDDEQSSNGPYARRDHTRSSTPDAVHAPRHELFESSPARNGSSKSIAGTWNQISGLAAGMFGTPPRGSSQQRRDPRHSLPVYSTSTAQPEWGPPLQHKDVGAGSTDKRALKLRDEKRKALLSGSDLSIRMHAGHKRRTSDDLTDHNALQDDPDQELLVYIHHVKPGDTLPGISIRYNCQAAALRKANRIWPNDPIQSRKIIYVPVDASGIKGKPFTGHETTVEEDLLGDETITLHESPQLSRSPKQGASAFQEVIPSAPLSPASTSNNTDSEYKHESWVIFPNDKSPTEIARLSKSNLGFFPRARRKSIGFSDRSTSRNTSFDLGRTVQSSPLIRPQDTVTENPLPNRRPHSHTRPPTSRARSSSNPVSSLLRGPGGVGTMGRNVRTIGPGNERLTELFGSHLYSVAPPQHQTVFTPWTPSLILENEDGIARTAVDANGIPIDASSARGLDLQDIGGAVEGWVRKFAKKAATALEPSTTDPTVSRSGRGINSSRSGNNNSRTRSSAHKSAHSIVGVQDGLLGGGGMGDLIELVDAFDINNNGSSINNGSSHSGGGDAKTTSLIDVEDDTMMTKTTTTKTTASKPATLDAIIPASSSSLSSTSSSAANAESQVRGRKTTRSARDARLYF